MGTRKRTAKTVRKCLPDDSLSQPLERSRLIVEYAHDSAQALFEAFATVKKKRGAKRGTTTDEEQDLLRAMLVMAAAGVDSALKELIRDALPRIIDLDPDAQSELETFVTRQLRGESEPSGASLGNKFLARVLAAKSQQRQVIEEYILDLTGVSLQSAEELFRAVKALGLDPQAVGIDRKSLKPIFDVRNRVIHEMDINFGHPKRNRQTRSMGEMCEYTNSLLELIERIVVGVEKKLSEEV